jgi:hypothetical protein
MELICGACHGRLLAEVPGTTVACPHCGTHLHTPAAPAPPVELPLALDTEDDPAHAANAEGDTVNINLAGQLHATPPDVSVPEAFAVEKSPAVSTIASTEPAGVETSQLPVPVASASAATAPEDPPGAVLASPSSAELPISAIAALATEGIVDPGDHAVPADAFVTVGIDADGAVNISVPAVGETSHMDQELASVVQETPAVVRKGVSPTAFLLVASYASAMTLACLFLLYQRKHNPGTLDLPDLAPPAQTVQGKRVSLKKLYLPEEKPVPSANVLKLGESRQYGSVKVTPLRVTRGPVEFSFYKADEDQEKEAEGPVLKLHLRFENVSPDQDFVPLDSELVYAKDVTKSGEMFNHHNFVSNVGQRGTRAKHAYTFDLKPGGMWLIKDQHIDEKFGPGQVLETFIPTTAEEIEALEGDLVWRVHFRKGYNRTSYRGVTTLIEVLFNSSEIVDDPHPVNETRPADGPTGEPAIEPAEKPTEKPDDDQPDAKAATKEA